MIRFAAILVLSGCAVQTFDMLGNGVCRDVDAGVDIAVEDGVQCCGEVPPAPSERWQFRLCFPGGHCCAYSDGGLPQPDSRIPPCCTNTQHCVVGGCE